MARAGFFRSPDILTPESMPVTAGKYMAKSIQKVYLLPSSGAAFAAKVLASKWITAPERNAIIDRVSMAITTYCALTTTAAPRNDSMAVAANIA
ncbi:hypothetical protein R80B4_02588 [Fibrobacteres bacterium R8-0-B4]